MESGSVSDLILSAKRISLGHFLTISRNVGQFTSLIVGIGQCDGIGRRKEIRQCDPGFMDPRDGDIREDAQVYDQS